MAYHIQGKSIINVNVNNNLKAAPHFYMLSNSVQLNQQAITIATSFCWKQTKWI